MGTGAMCAGMLWDHTFVPKSRCVHVHVSVVACNNVACAPATSCMYECACMDGPVPMYIFACGAGVKRKLYSLSPIIREISHFVLFCDIFRSYIPWSRPRWTAPALRLRMLGVHSSTWPTLSSTPRLHGPSCKPSVPSASFTQVSLQTHRPTHCTGRPLALGLEPHFVWARNPCYIMLPEMCSVITLPFSSFPHGMSSKCMDNSFSLYQTN